VIKSIVPFTQKFYNKKERFPITKKEISSRDFMKGAAAKAARIATMAILTACSDYDCASAATAAPAAKTTTTAKETTDQTLSETAAAGTGGMYIPGTYTASASSIGEVTMAATFDENSIAAIELDLSNKTENIGQVMKDDLIEQIMKAQSAEIDNSEGTLNQVCEKRGITEEGVMVKGLYAAGKQVFRS